MSPLQVFIGVDERQPLDYTVCRSSIERHASNRVNIEALQLRFMPIKRRGLTQFTFSRYLVPWLMNYEGQGIFMDADIIVRGDIYELADLAAKTKAPVSVVKGMHRFEWPSMMVFDNAQCKDLTSEYIETQQPQKLNWAFALGDLPSEWNHCVGYDTPNPDAKLIHYTQGIPCWEETKDCEHSEAWMDEFRQAVGTVSWWDIMGNSVHAEHVIGRLHASGKGEQYKMKEPPAKQA